MDMESILCCEDLWFAIVGYPDEDTTPGLARQAKDRKAKGYINLHLSTSIKPHVMRAAIARDAWTTLEKTYSEAGVNATISHIGELVSVMLADHPSISAARLG